MKHYFESYDLSGRISSAYWAEEEDVTSKSWREDHSILRCSEVGGACCDENEHIDYRGAGWYASMMEGNQVFSHSVLLDIDDYDRDFGREEYARLRAKSMSLGTVFRID